MTARARRRSAPRATRSAALEAIGNAPALLEGLVRFEREISVIVVRGQDGALAFYDPVENVHQNGILAISRAPARIAPDTAAAAKQIAGKVARRALAMSACCAWRCSSAKARSPR